MGAQVDGLLGGTAAGDSCEVCFSERASDLVAWKRGRGTLLSQVARCTVYLASLLRFSDLVVRLSSLVVVGCDLGGQIYFQARWQSDLWCSRVLMFE